MRMTAEDIKAALLKGERMTLECKSATNGLPKSVWESYSAFANTLGGIILLGVEEHRKEAGWKTPTLDNDLDTNEVKVTLFIPDIKESEQKSEQKSAQSEFVHNLDNERDKSKGGQKDKQTGKQKSKQKSKQRGSSMTEHLILEIIRLIPDITRAELAERTNKSESMVYKCLTKLKEAGLIRRVGPDKGGHWEVLT